MQPWAVQYRPRTFAEVLGQPEKAHLRLLLGAGDDFPNLLLLRGPSGTGKTTIARIVAAALNCPDVDKQTGDPCTKCDSCVAIHEGNYPSVYEYDAASNNGADAMRELRDRTFHQPLSRYNVFILDEAQSLSPAAWNVLLKIFEEPPPFSVFILVTSEPTKVPTKIRTRAVAYDFGYLMQEDIVQGLERILKAENVTVEGLDTLVDLSEGSMRQAIMLLEQSYRSGKTPDELLLKKDTSLDILEALVRGDSAAGTNAINTMWTAVGDARYIMERISLMTEKVLLYRHKVPVVVSVTSEPRIAALSQALDDKKLSCIMETLATWYPQTHVKAHVLFFWADVMKSLYGKTKPTAVAAPVVKPVVEAAPVRTASASLAESLKELELE